MRRVIASLCVMLLAPTPVLACAACAAASDSNRVFFIMTIVMSLLPLALIGGGLWWIARQARGRLAGEFVDRDALAGSSPGPGAAPSGSPRPTMLPTPGAGAK